MKHREFKRSGFTLVESVIAMVLLGVVLGGLSISIQRGTDLFKQSIANQDVDSRVDRTIDRVARELMGVSAQSLPPALTIDPASPPGTPIPWTSTLTFQEATDWVAGGIVLGPTRRLEFRLAQSETLNNIDDNGNGLVDEHSIYRIDNFGTANEQEVVLVNGVMPFLEGETDDNTDENGNGLIDETGLSFDLNGNTLNVRISIAKRGPAGDLIVRTQVASISLRN